MTKNISIKEYEFLNLFDMRVSGYQLDLFSNEYFEALNKQWEEEKRKILEARQKKIDEIGIYKVWMAEIYGNVYQLDTIFEEDSYVVRELVRRMGTCRFNSLKECLEEKKKNVEKRSFYFKKFNKNSWEK